MRNKGRQSQRRGSQLERPAGAGPGRRCMWHLECCNKLRMLEKRVHPKPQNLGAMGSWECAEWHCRVKGTPSALNCSLDSASLDPLMLWSLSP